MKKILFTLFIFFALLVNAKADLGKYDINSAVNKINDSFIVNYDDYRMYIKIGNMPYRFENGKALPNSNLLFNNGGMLNKEEYSLSLNTAKETYLFNPNEYWIMTQNSGKYYSNNTDSSSIDFPLHSTDDSLGVRPTEYVRNESYIAGKGTYSEPWVFIGADINLLYDTQGGTTCNKKTVIYNKEYGTLCSTTKAGYKFDGWYTESTGGTLINSNSIVSNKTDHTLYAHWFKNEYTITLNNNGATTNGTSSIQVLSNSSNTSTITNPKKEYTINYNVNGTGATLGTTTSSVEYIFNGWYTAASGGSKVIDSTGKYVASVSGYTDSNSKWIKESNTTLYAQWSENNTSLTTAIKTNSICKWNTNSAGTGTSYMLGYAYVPKSNVTLYAICVNSLYTLTLNGNGATTNGTTTATVNLNSSTISTITSPTKKYTISYNLNGSGATTTSSTTTSTYTLNGWYTSASGGTKVIDSAGKLVANVANYTNSSRQWIKEGGATLYAQWVSKAITLATLTKANSVCTWNTNSAGNGVIYNSGASFTPTSNTTLYAICVPKINTYWTGSYEFVAPIDGEYKLEVWGASGGKHINKTGYGAYAYGTIHLNKGTKLYIVAGGIGESTYGGTTGAAGGTNGGGAGGNGSPTSYWGDYSTYQGGGGGGGASHIATASGYLPSLVNNKNSVVIVAGGGGGSPQWGNGLCDEVRGNAGGYIGNNGGSIGSQYAQLANSGGTQTSGYAFGQGQKGRSVYSFADCGSEGGGGGGGGYYGGKTYQGTGNFSSKNGAGGSSFIGGNVNGNYLYNKGMICVDCATNNTTNLYTRSVSRNTALGWDMNNNSLIPKTGAGYARVTILQ